jgi:hypothetical protein
VYCDAKHPLGALLSGATGIGTFPEKRTTSAKPVRLW